MEAVPRVASPSRWTLPLTLYIIHAALSAAPMQRPHKSTLDQSPCIRAEYLLLTSTFRENFTTVPTDKVIKFNTRLLGQLTCLSKYILCRAIIPEKSYPFVNVFFRLQSVLVFHFIHKVKVTWFLLGNLPKFNVRFLPACFAVALIVFQVQSKRLMLPKEINHWLICKYIGSNILPSEVWLP